MTKKVVSPGKIQGNAKETRVFWDFLSMIKYVQICRIDFALLLGHLELLDTIEMNSTCLEGGAEATRIKC